MFNRETIDQLLQALTAVGIGSISSGVKYVYMTLKGESFKIGTFFSYLFVGGFVGYITDQFLPPERGFRGAIIGVSAFLSFQILEFVEKNGLKILVNKVFNKSELTDFENKTLEEEKKSSPEI